MNRFLLLAALALGCGDGDFPPEECDPPLPASDDDGEPWPTYTEASAALAACMPDAGTWRRGACSDGKLFIEQNGGFTGETQYFDGETLVGLSRFTDVVTSCDEYRFGDTACEEASSEDVSCR